MFLSRNKTILLSPKKASYISIRLPALFLLIYFLSVAFYRTQHPQIKIFVCLIVDKNPYCMSYLRNFIMFLKLSPSICMTSL